MLEILSTIGLTPLERENYAACLFSSGIWIVVTYQRQIKIRNDYNNYDINDWIDVLASHEETISETEAKQKETTLNKACCDSSKEKKHKIYNYKTTSEEPLHL